MTSNDESGANKWWERVSEASELRQHADKWSLAGDSATATVLNKISEQLVLRTEELSSKLNTLVQNVGDLATEVANTNNSFTMLSHTQFIENRTYMDDERAPVAEALPDTPGPCSEPPSTVCRRALLGGLETFNACYQAHQLADSDVEEGDSPDSPTSIYTLTNPYAGRPLPHIIMSREFMVDPLVGLQLPPSDDDEDEVREEVAVPEQEDGDTSASDEDIGDSNIFTKDFQATSSRIVEDDSDSDWSDSIDIEKLKRQRNELIQQEQATSALPNGTPPSLHPPPRDSTPTVSDSQVAGLLPTRHNSRRPNDGRRPNAGPMLDSDSDEEFFKPIAAPGHNSNLFGDPRQPPGVTAALQQRLGQHRTAPSSSDSDDEGLFNSGVGRRRPPPLPGGSQHPSSTSSPAASVAPASDDLSTVVRSTNVENVRAFPDVNPIANKAGRGAQRPSSQALQKPQVPGARGLFSSDTEEDDLFGSAPPPLNKLSSDVRGSLAPGYSTLAAPTSSTKATRQQQQQQQQQQPAGGGLFGSDEDEGEGPSDSDATVPPPTAAVAEVLPVTASGRRVPVGGVNIFSSAVTAAIRRPSSGQPQERGSGQAAAPVSGPHLQQQQDLEQQHRLVQQHQQQIQKQQQQLSASGSSQREVPKPATVNKMGSAPSLSSGGATPGTGALPFGSAKTGGLGLFDDDDDDDDLFGSSTSAPRQQHGGSSSSSAPVAGDVKKIAASARLSTPAPPTVDPPISKVPPPAVSHPTPPSVVPPSPAPASGGIFSSDDDDLFSSSSLPTSATKKSTAGPVVGQSVVGPSSKILDKPVTAVQSNVTGAGKNSLPSAAAAAAAPVAQKAVSLFEDSDDDLFSSKISAPISSGKITATPVPTIASKTSPVVPSQQSTGQPSLFGDDSPGKNSKVPAVSVATPKTSLDTPSAPEGNNSSSQSTVARPQSGGLFSSGSDEDLFGSSALTKPSASASTISALQATVKLTRTQNQAPAVASKPVVMDHQRTSKPFDSGRPESSGPSKPLEPQITKLSLAGQVQGSSHTDAEKSLPISSATSTTVSEGATDTDLPRIPVIPIPISADQHTVNTDQNESGSRNQSEFIDSSSDDEFLFSPSPHAPDTAVGTPPAFFASDSSDDESFPSVANAIGYQRKDGAQTSAVSGSGSPGSQGNKTLPPNRKRSSTKKVKFSAEAEKARFEKPITPVPKACEPTREVKDSSKTQQSVQSRKNTPSIDSKVSVLPRQPESDSDDLFADMPSVTGIKASEKVTNKSSALFLSDDDDIFAAPPSSSSALAKPMEAKPLSPAAPSSLLTGQKPQPVISLLETNDVKNMTSLTAEGDAIEDDIFDYLSGEDMFDSGAKQPPSSIPSVSQPSSAGGKVPAKPKLEPIPSAGRDASNDVGDPDRPASSVVDGKAPSTSIPETPLALAPSIGSGQSPLKKKPPVGGVALFGGSELLAKVGKRRQTVDEDEQPTKLHEDEAKIFVAKENDGAGEAKDTLASDKPLVGKKPHVGLQVKPTVPVKAAPAVARPSTGAGGSVDGSDQDESPATSPRKKPVGGVSMFGGGGGAELFAKLKKRQDRLSSPGSDSESATNTSADTTPSEEHKPFVPLPLAPNARPPADASQRPATKIAPLSPVKKFLGIHGLNKGPSLVSPPHVSKEEAASFETPVVVPVLNSLSKSRPKVSSHRRLPTRQSKKSRDTRQGATAADAADVVDGPSSQLDTRPDGFQTSAHSPQTQSVEDRGVDDKISSYPGSKQPVPLPSQLSGLLTDALVSGIADRNSSLQSSIMGKHEGSENLDSGLGSLKSETSSPKTYEKVDESSAKGPVLDESRLTSKATSSDRVGLNSGPFSSSEDEDSLFGSSTSKTESQAPNKSSIQSHILDIEQVVASVSSVVKTSNQTAQNNSATVRPSVGSRSNGVQSYPGPTSNYDSHQPLAATSSSALPGGGLFQKESDSDSDGIFGSSIGKVRTESASSVGGASSSAPVGGGAPVSAAVPSKHPTESVSNQTARVSGAATGTAQSLKTPPSLFADDDDDDDLFGGGRSVGGVVVQKQARPPAPSTAAGAAASVPSMPRALPAQATPKDSGAFQDPLSDLLK